VKIGRFDIGIMPLRDSPWERGKCGYKLIQYLGSGKPVVASPIGVNVEIIEGNGVGILARTTDDWIQAVHTLAGSETLREEMGARGRRLVEAKYSVHATAPHIVELLCQACA
jgi:glycosyltransferase involved in cell wall biosynthesis